MEKHRGRAPLARVVRGARGTPTDPAAGDSRSPWGRGVSAGPWERRALPNERPAHEGTGRTRPA
ncbi:hypothetical protein GCM10017688_23510 [Streptomyces ramulosus]